MRRIDVGVGESGAARARPAWWKRKRVLIPAALLGLFAGIGLAGPAPVDDGPAPAPYVSREASSSPAGQTQNAGPTKTPAVPAEHQAALSKAQVYVDTMHLSKAGLRDQLTSEYGEQFPVDAADYAVENVKADWKANALVKAKEYRDSMSMSNSAIRDQLVSEYGEKFTKAEAEWAMDRLDE